MRMVLAVIAALMTVGLASQATAQGADGSQAPADVQALFERPTTSHVSLSPDGALLAFVTRVGDAEALIIQDLNTGMATTLVSLSRQGEYQAGHSFHAVYWTDDRRLLLHLRARRVLLDREGNLRSGTLVSEFMAVNVDGSDAVRVNLRSDRLRREEVIHLLPDDPDGVLLQVIDAHGFLGVSRVDLRSGEVQPVIEGGRGVIAYYTGSNGDVIARIRIVGSAGRWGLIEGRDASGRWTRIADYFASDLRETPDFQFIGAGPRPGELYAIVRPPAGSTPDTAAIHVYDLTTRTLGERIAQHDTYDMAGLLMDQHTGEALAGCYQADMWRCDFEDPAIGRQMAGLLTFFENERDIRVVSQDRARRHWVLGVSGATEPGSFYLYDSETRSVDIIGEAYGAMAALDLAEMERVDYQARDGQALHGYLTLPTTDRPGPHALIVLPHGGPEARDAIGFDPWVQFLASRGYAVFQPNFRGSSGFGRGFAEAGYRQWGQRMQDDVTDGVQALIAQGVVDPGQICIMGASYGGYAALWGGASQPDLYRCVISIAGVSDLREMLQWTRRAYGSDSETFGYWETAIGEYGRDREALEAVSPIRHVSTWRPPVLLIHGTQDYTVPVEQSQEMDEALRRAGRDVRYVEMERQGHQFTDEANAAQLLVEVGNFLALHLPTPENRPR